MNYRPLLITNAVLIAGMAVLSAWAWNQVPDGALIPVHWDVAGHANRLRSKTEALMLFPAVAVIVTAMMWILPRFDPRRANLEASGKFWNAAAILIGLLLAYLHLLITMGALGRPVDMPNAMIPALCLLFAGLGNYLGKTKSNWFGGVRTPWTMSSEYSWEKTHRLAGYMFVLSSVLTFATWLLTGPTQALAVLLGAMLITVLSSVVMSYVFWRADPDRAENGN